MTSSTAYEEGVKAAKNGTNINNSYPYTKGQPYQDWLAGYRSIKPEAKIDQTLYDLTKRILKGTDDDYLD